MSLFGKIFKKKEPPVPSTKEAIDKLRETEDVLLKKQDFLENKISEALETAKKHSSTNKRLALQALKRKKLYEKEQQQNDGVLYKIMSQRESLENVTTNVEIFDTMRQASKALEKSNKGMTVEDVEDLMDQITDQSDIGNEISQALSNTGAFGQAYDEDELMAELLEVLEEEDLEKQTMNATPMLIDSLSTRLPITPKDEPQLIRKQPSKRKDEDDHDLAELESWATA